MTHVHIQPYSRCTDRLKGSVIFYKIKSSCILHKIRRKPRTCKCTQSLHGPIFMIHSARIGPRRAPVSCCSNMEALRWPDADLFKARILVKCDGSAGQTAECKWSYWSQCCWSDIQPPLGARDHSTHLSQIVDIYSFPPIPLCVFILMNVCHYFNTVYCVFVTGLDTVYLDINSTTLL